MTQDLYRKEAIQYRHRSLYGTIILKSPPKSWWITLLLFTLLIGLIAALLFIKIPTDTEAVSLYQWLTSANTNVGEG